MSYSSQNGNPLQPKPYNPLDKTALAKSVENELLSRGPQRLDGVPRFLGAGIYVLYYTGGHPLYQPISGSSIPIYVGKAAPKGGRKALTDEAKVGPDLWNRIDEHRESTAHAENLDPADFLARYLVADELFIPLAERLMIRNLRPVWNQVVDGFGNHNPGSGRYEGMKPGWDTLHPGRPWAARLRKPGKYTREQLVARVNEHFGIYSPETLKDNLPPGSANPVEQSPPLF